MSKRQPRPAQPPVATATAKDIRLPPNVIAGAVVVLFVLLGGAYRALVPFGQGPDEESHALFVATLAGEVTPAEGWAWGLPVFSTRPDDPNFELHQPPLYYGLAAIAYRLGGLSLAAAWNLLAGALVVWLTWRLARRLAADDVALAAAAWVALLPMHGFMALRINNDPLAVLWWTVCLWCWVTALVEGPSRRLGIQAGLALGAALLTKQNGIVLVPLAAIAGHLIYLRTGRRREAAAMLGWTLALAALVAGWWYLRNLTLYGDLFAHRAFDERFLHPEAGRTTPAQLMAQMAAAGRQVSYPGLVFEWTVRTFVIYIGSGFQRLPAGVFNLHLALTAALGLASTWVIARRWRTRGLDAPVAAALLMAAGVLGVLAVYVRFNLTYFQAQGRYLHVLLPAWAMLCCAGAARLGSPGSPWRRYGVLIAPLWLALQSALILGVWLPGLFDPPA